MRIKFTIALLGAALTATLAWASPAGAAEPCVEAVKAKCFAIESLDAALSTSRAGAHPDLSFSFELAQDPASEPNEFGLRDAYAPVRDLRFEMPPGLVGDPNVLGASQQCTAVELTDSACPNGSQIGLARVLGYELNSALRFPVYMMRPPGGDVIARVGISVGIGIILIDIEVRSEDDYGLTAMVSNAPTAVKLLRVETALWGVPADPVHDNQRCRPEEVLFGGCITSPTRPPGQSPTPFLTNGTRCGVAQEMRVSASSWTEPSRFVSRSTPFPPFTECNRLSFGPNLVVEPTNRVAGAPAGLDMTFRLPAPAGVNVLEPSGVRDIRIDLPVGMSINPGAADGLATCSVEQVRFGERVNAECPDAAKFGVAEFDVPALPRKAVGSIYIREPVPGKLFRVWLVADDQGAHVKLPAELEVDEASGQISSVVFDVPQVPVREVKLVLKSGFRAPMLNPPACGTYEASYEFVPWSGNPPVRGKSPFEIDQGCAVGGFDPKLSAGAVNPTAGAHSPFVFTLRREDGEQNPATLDITLPRGMAATFRGIPRCDGAAALSGACPDASRIGRVLASAGAGPAPLWIPQPGKRPTAVYLGGPYKGGPLSVIAVVPAQAGPFDFGDEVVRSAVHVNPVTAEARIVSDRFPQQLEGIPIPYRTLHVAVDRPNFTLNPTGCEQKSVAATVASAAGAVATPTTPFAAANCSRLGFKPRISMNLKGGTKRGQFPALRSVIRSRPGDANIAGAVVRMPRSIFLEQSHFQTICTRVQYAADACPPGATYGWVRAFTPLLDEPLEGPVLLRSSNNKLPDMVFDLRGLIDVEASGRIDSVGGGMRATFPFIPDAPISKVVLSLRGGKKGMIVNSRDVCARKYRATVELEAHNEKSITLKPRVKPQCKKKGRKGKKTRRS